MNDQDQILYQGKPLTDDAIQELAAAFEKDWDLDKISVRLTEYGKTQKALQEIGIPANEIAALERRAQSEQIPFSSYVRSLIERELTA